MNDATSIRLGHEAKIRLPTPDEVMDLGLARHAADDRTLTGTIAQQDARQLVSNFMELKPRDGNDVEVAYISGAQAIALSHGRALTRRKEAWQAEMNAAQEHRELELGYLRQARHQNAYLNVAWSLLAPSILALTGYLVAQVIGPWLPDEITSQTGHKLPSILMSAVFVFVGRVTSFLIADFQRSLIDLQYHARIHVAQMAYAEGKLKEHKLYRTRLCDAWEQYTGEKFLATSSYEMVLLGDIKMLEQMEQQRLTFHRTSLWKIRRCAQFLQWALRRKRR